MYAVEFTHSESGERQVSRYFETVGKARNWGKWLAKQSWARGVRVMAGGAGGMQVWEADADDPRINGFNVEFLGAQRARVGEDY